MFLSKPNQQIPSFGIDTDGNFVLLPSEDSGPSTEESFSIIPEPGPDQTNGATHTLHEYVMSLSSGLAVIIPFDYCSSRPILAWNSGEH